MIAELVEDVLDRVTLKNIVLQLVQHLSFQPVPPNGQRIRAGATIEVLRAAIARMMARRVVPRNDNQIASAETALEDAAEEIFAGSGTRNQNPSALPTAIHGLQLILPFLYTPPQFVTDDLKLRVRNNAPFALRPRSPDALVRARHLYKARTVPDHLSSVEIAPEHLPDAGGAPCGVLLSSAWPRRRNALAIESLGDSLERLPFSRHLEDATNHGSFAFVDDELLSGSAGNGNRVIAEAAPACMLAAQHETFKSAMGFLGKLLHVQTVHHAVNRHQHMRLLVFGVDALTDGDQPDAGEVQPLEDTQSILRIPGKSAAVIKQDDVEGAGGRQSRIQQPAKPRTVSAHAAQSFIGIDMLFEEDEPAGMGVLAANTKLVLN